MRRSVLASALVIVAVVSGSGCTGKGSDAGSATGGASGAAAGADTAVAVPVQGAVVTRSPLAVTVSGPGRTDVIAEQHIRAPFQGIVAGFSIAPGDRVVAGQTLGSIVSQTSQAALAGAQSLLSSASTPAERADAERAVQLARRGVVRVPIRAPRSGILVSRPASAGELVAPGDSLATIAPAGSVVFIAQLAQGDALRVRPGQTATVALAGAAPVAGIVRTALPADSAGGLTVPVRIQLAQSRAMPTIGLFGTATIVVSQRSGAITVPAPAVLRDDINGISRVATIGRDGKAHWVTVTPGVSEGGLTEILSPVLDPGTRVITAGQVGLPDGTRVRVTPPSGTGGGSASEPTTGNVVPATP